MDKKLIPRSRVRNIMIRSADVEKLSKESIHLVAAAAELFLDQLVKTVKKSAEDTIDYKHVAEVVNSQEKYCFLQEIIPRKITVKQWKMLLTKKLALEDTSSSDSNPMISSDVEENEDNASSVSVVGSEQYYGDDDSSHNSP